MLTPQIQRTLTALNLILWVVQIDGGREISYATEKLNEISEYRLDTEFDIHMTKVLSAKTKLDESVDTFLVSAVIHNILRQVAGLSPFTVHPDIARTLYRYVCDLDTFMSETTNLISYMCKADPLFIVDSNARHFITMGTVMLEVNDIKRFLFDKGSINE